MLSSVLRSDRAIHVNIQIMGAFVRLRRLLATHEELARKLDALELVPAAAVAPALPWRELAAMHNRIIHAYWDVNRDIVWKAATEEVPDLLPKLQALLAGQGDKRWWDASVLLRLMWEAWNEVFRDVIGPAEQTPLFEGGAA